MGPLIFLGLGVAALVVMSNRRSAPQPTYMPPVPPPARQPTAAKPSGVNGDAGMTLRRAQEILLSLGGYDLGASGADGKYGPRTRAALIKYQVSKMMPANGILDRNTAAALGSERSAAVPPPAKEPSATTATKKASSSNKEEFDRGYAQGLVAADIGLPLSAVIEGESPSYRAGAIAAFTDRKASVDHVDHLYDDKFVVGDGI